MVIKRLEYGSRMPSTRRPRHDNARCPWASLGRRRVVCRADAMWDSEAQLRIAYLRQVSFQLSRRKRAIPSYNQRFLYSPYRIATITTSVEIVRIANAYGLFPPGTGTFVPHRLNTMVGMVNTTVIEVNSSTRL